MVPLFAPPGLYPLVRAPMRIAEYEISECVKPSIGTDSCQASHIGVLAKGTMTVRMDDGTEVNYEAGDAYMIGPGHDAWITSAEGTEAYEVSFDKADIWHD